MHRLRMTTPVPVGWKRYGLVVGEKFQHEPFPQQKQGGQRYESLPRVRPEARLEV